ncbi:MAG: hypothetical protein CL916_06155 [Deltaproteobacteria bacterium]|nr:hypothetical protein [Deltaproteobacteria bacterium]
MWQVMDGVSTGLTTRSIFDSIKRTKNSALVHWAESSGSDRPALVFVPGFLSENFDDDKMEDWKSGIVEVAERYDFEAYGLFWPSGTVWDLLMGTSWNRTMAACAAPRLGMGLLAPVLLNPLLLAPALGIGLPSLWNAMDVWKKAVANADEVSKDIHQWLGLINRPVILVGHSLGGRIVLKASANARRYNVLQTYAFAPAVQEEDCNFNKIRAHVEEKSTIFYSQNDTTLNVWYRIGEMTWTPPLGYTGITQKKSSSKVQSLDVSNWGDSTMKHDNYRYFVSELLNDRRLHTTIDEWE